MNPNLAIERGPHIVGLVLECFRGAQTSNTWDIMGIHPQSDILEQGNIMAMLTDTSHGKQPLSLV